MELSFLNAGFCYPFDLVDNLALFPLEHAIPCSVLFNNDATGGLLLICPASDLEFFDIVPPNHPDPYLKLRMLNIDFKSFAIEIHLGFGKDRILKIHLNPACESTKEFIQLCLKTKMISIHYYNKKKRLFTSSITELDDEHEGWLKRNYELAKNLPPSQDYLSICKALFYEMKVNQRLYHYYENDSIDCFIREGAVVAKFEDDLKRVPSGWKYNIWN